MATATKTKRKSRTKSSPTVRVIFSTFDSNNPVYRTVRDTAIGNWKPISSEHYCPRGGTPLLDATAQFIAHLEKLKKTGTVVIGCLADESGSMGGNTQSVIDGVNEFVGGMKDVDDVDPEADGKVLAVILTDGFENASHEVTNTQLMGLISTKESEGWTFIYLGANQDAWATGGAMGYAHTVNFASSPVGTQSAMRYAGGTASSYLMSNAATVDSLSSGTVSEEGEFSQENTSPLASSQAYNIGDAIDKAKGKK